MDKIYYAGAALVAVALVAAFVTRSRAEHPDLSKITSGHDNVCVGSPEFIAEHCGDGQIGKGNTIVEDPAHAMSNMTDCIAIGVGATCSGTMPPVTLTQPQGMISCFPDGTATVTGYRSYSHEEIERVCGVRPGRNSTDEP